MWSAVCHLFRRFFLMKDHSAGSSSDKPAAAFRGVLGTRAVFSLAFGAMIGWGWVIMSGEMISDAGTLGSIAALLTGAVMIGFVGLTYAELTPALPRAGGELGFLFLAFGPSVSWVCGWVLLLARVYLRLRLALRRVETVMSRMRKNSRSMSCGGGSCMQPTVEEETRVLALGRARASTSTRARTRLERTHLCAASAALLSQQKAGHSA